VREWGRRGEKGNTTSGRQRGNTTHIRVEEKSKTKKGRGVRVVCGASKGRKKQTADGLQKRDDKTV